MFASTQTKHKYQQKHKQIKIILPSTVKANFSSNSIINNQKLKTQIKRNMHPSPQLTQYILDKTVWSRYTFKLVDWEPNKTSFNIKTEQKKVNLSKFTLSSRPTTEYLHKSN